MGKHINKIPKLLTQKELRDERRYKQRDIANGTGLSEGMISRLLRDKDIGNLTYASAKALARWLEVPMEALAESDIDEGN